MHLMLTATAVIIQNSREQPIRVRSCEKTVVSTYSAPAIEDDWAKIGWGSIYQITTVVIYFNVNCNIFIMECSRKVYLSATPQSLNSLECLCIYANSNQ